MKQKFIEWFTKNNNGCSPAMEDDRSFVYEMTQHMFEAYQAGVAEGEARCAALAAENAGLKKAAEFATAPDMWIEQADGMLDYRYCEWYVDVLKAAMETPATDAFLAEVRARGVEMFAKETGESDQGNGLMKAISRRAIKFAAQLRKGVQS